MDIQPVWVLNSGNRGHGGCCLWSMFVFMVKAIIVLFLFGAVVKVFA
jgi:hypothetical protein